MSAGPIRVASPVTQPIINGTSLWLPASNQASVAFQDTRSGAPKPVQRDQGSGDGNATYLEIGGESNEELYADFAPSLTVMTTILNAYFPGRLTTDAGAKALTLNKPDPIVIGEKFSYNAGSDEFGTIRYEAASKSYQVGDRLAELG